MRMGLAPNKPLRVLSDASCFGSNALGAGQYALALVLKFLEIWGEGSFAGDIAVPA